MKKIIHLVVVSLAVITFSACDKIEGPTRENNNSGVVIGDKIVIDGDTITFPENTSPASSHVLVEDYTGHLCGSCPPAGIQLNDSMRAAFGDQLVVISVHSGQFADVCPTALDCPPAAPAGAFTVNYRTSVGNAWTTKFGVSANPIGMVNRSGYPSSHKKTFSTWKTTAQGELNNAPSAKMDISLNYDNVSRKLKAGVKTEMVQAYNGTIKLQMVVVEDSIISWQQWYSHVPTLVPDFIHHNVLRTSMNGNFGDTLSVSTNTNVGEKLFKGYFSTLASNWDYTKCKVIAFIYDADTYKVIQVVEKRIY